MDRRVVVAALFALFVICFGCGGSSSGGTATTGMTATTGTTATAGTTGTTGANPYEGTYSGEYEDQYDNVGTFSLTVTAAGGVNGQFGTSAGGTFTGNTTAQSFTGSASKTGGGSFKFSNGTDMVIFGPAGQSSLRALVLLGTSTIEYQLAAITNPNGKFGGTNPFAGDFAGTVSYPSLGKTGVVAITIASNGSVSGWEVVDVGTSAPTLGSLSGTVSAAGVVNYTVTTPNKSGDETLTGNLKYTTVQGKISGALADSNGDSTTISLTQLQPVGT